MIPNSAPGCFGSALAFAKDNAICLKCPFAPSCETLHQENLTLLREKLGIKSKDKRVRQAVPVKVQELVDRLQAFASIVPDLKQGKNPFPKSMPFMHIVGHLLLRAGSFDRQLLSAAFTAKLNWTQETADAHARMAFQALVHMGVAEERAGRISVKP